MRPGQRLEVVINEAWLPRLQEILNNGELGFSVLPVLFGHGGRGDRFQNDIAGDSNVYVLCSGTKEQLEPHIPAVTDVLRLAGGHAILTDAHIMLREPSPETNV